MSVAVWLGGLHGAPWYVREPDAAYYAASLVKVPIAVAADRLDLTARVSVHDEFDSVVAGERYRLLASDDQDPVTWGELGGTQTLGELRRRMLVDSGNLASALVLEATGPVPGVARGIGDEPARRAGLDNVVTARSVAAWMIGVPAAVETILVYQRYRAGIPSALGIPVANKTGWIDDLDHDAALVRPPDGSPAVLVVLTLGEPEGTIAAAAREAWAHRR